MSNDVPVITGKTGQIYANSTTWTELITGSSRLAARKWLLVQNKSNVRVAFTTDTTQAYKSCPEIGVGQMIQIPASDQFGIYIKAKSGAIKRIAIMEMA